jgi:hypothetical protein
MDVLRPVMNGLCRGKRSALACLVTGAVVVCDVVVGGLRSEPRPPLSALILTTYGGVAYLYGVAWPSRQCRASAAP